MIKVVSACNDLASDMENRMTDIELAVHDMPAAANEILTRIHQLKSEYAVITKALLGDRTLAKREFETLPSINDRAYTLEYSLWGSTATVPGIYLDSYEIASKQIGDVLMRMKILNSSIEGLEKLLQVGKAPYTSGRWPVWEQK
jgi:Mg2+ and Co2+ transporter CorA